MPSNRAAAASTPPTPVHDQDALARARGDRWLPDPPLTTAAEAGTFIDRVGFTVLFPADKVIAPSLWEAVAGPDATPFAEGMGVLEARVWGWKDELPTTGAAWYGKFIHKRASLLSPALLTALYPGDGDPTDHAALDLPDQAHRIAEALLTGPLPTAALRELVGDRGRYDRAMSALQRHLLVTSAGVEERRAGWPATVMDLTCRLFDVGGAADPGYATARFAETMIEATPADLSRAFGWPIATARERLNALP
ncbi:hypothetical protein ACIBSW_13080 [Actinoplanes sp. NPDC049668]|uniref:AlkZ-related protein n=1 Tax=unclassified Actinoplanes TaxID=2626549 RepID=UPI0033BCE15A